MKRIPQWAHVLFHVLINIGTAYVAVQYPAFLPLVAAIGGTTQAAAAGITYATVPPAKTLPPAK
jgi:hypothetical protein